MPLKGTTFDETLNRVPAAVSALLSSSSYDEATNIAACSSSMHIGEIQKLEYDWCKAEVGIELVVECDPKGEVQISCIDLESLGKIISIQSMWRMILRRRKYRISIEGINLRQQVELTNMAAVTIQANYRRHSAMAVIMALRSDVVVCQSTVRRFLAMKKSNHLRNVRTLKEKRTLFLFRRLQHDREVDAATQIRAAYVGYTARRKNYLIAMNRVVAKEMQCATLIQATWRRFIASEYFALVVADVIVCQSVARRNVATISYKSALAKRAMAATVIQRTYRGFSEREFYHSIVADVITTQSVVRRWRATRKLYIIRQIKRTKEVDAATKIQATYVRTKEVDATTKIQATYVGFTARKNYHIAVKRVVTCQCAIRTMFAKNKLQELVRHRNMRATTIQATWRRYFASKHFMFTLLEIIICQSVARRKIASVTYNKLIAKREMAAVSIQKTYRRYREESMYIVFISDVTTTQTIARRWRSIRQLHMLRLIQTAREYNAATTIRAAYVGYTARKNYLVVVKSAITLQCAGRKMMAKKLCQEIQREMAAVRIQKSFRGFCERLKYQVTVAVLVIKRFEEQFHARKEWAAKRIQAAYRGYVTRCDYLITIADVITLQCAARTMISKTEMFVRRQVQLAREDNAATKIRAAYVGYITRKHYLITIDCIVTCQCAMRTMIARRRLSYGQSLKLTKELAAATKFQTAWRVYKAQVYYAKVIWAVMSIQNIFRCIKVKARRASAAVIIQSEFRSYISCTGKHFFAANDVSASAQTSLSHFSFQIASIKNTRPKENPPSQSNLG